MRKQEKIDKLTNELFFINKEISNLQDRKNCFEERKQLVKKSNQLINKIDKLR